MTKGKKRTTLLAVLACVFALVFSLGIMSACGNSEAASNETGGEWLYGTTAPAENLGNTGDYYLNTETLTAYVRTADGTWQQTALYSGSSKPADTEGETGDLFLDTKNGILYQKGASTWGVVLTLKGQPGRDGVVWFSGEGNPNTLEDKTPLKDAHAGDFYLKTPEFDVYQLQADGSWKYLGTTKGDKGKDAKDPVQFFDGKGTPAQNAELLKDAKDGDLYLGVFDGFDNKGAGSRLYRYDAEKEDWNVLMDTVTANQIDIYTLAQLNAFAEEIGANNGYAGKDVHLKANIDFDAPEAASLRKNAPRLAGDWTPIGTSEVPFKGTFDGEGHIIFNFKTEVSTDATKVGFFGNVEGANIHDLHFVNVTVDATVAESSSEDAIGAVVVGQAQGATTVKNVTVKEATVQTAEETKATVGGLVGKLESSATEDETSLKVDGSSFEGTVQSTVEGTKPQSVDSLVANQDAVSDDKVTFTDSSVTDGEGNKTAWDESGKHYAEDTEGNLSYFVSSAQDITDLLSEAEGSVNVTLESDLTLNGSETFSVGADLTIDVGEKNLTVQSQGTNAGIQVEAGKNLTITGAENGNVQLNSASSKPAISVKGNGTTLNIEGANVDVKNQGSNKPAILAEAGGTVNLKDNTISVEGTPSNTSYSEPQVANVTGKGSVLNIENTTVNSTNATAFYVENAGTLNFKSGEINYKGGDFCAAIAFGEGAGKVVFSGGTINIRGDLTGVRTSNTAFRDMAIAIGGTADTPSSATLIMNGGTINLENTSGIAIAIGGLTGYGDNCYAYVGDGATINTRATGSGKAYVTGAAREDPVWDINIYAGTNLNGIDEVNNFRMPDFFAPGLGGGWIRGGLVDFRPYDNGEYLPEEYTKEAMGLVPHN